MWGHRINTFCGDIRVSAFCGDIKIKQFVGTSRKHNLWGHQENTICGEIITDFVGHIVNTTGWGP